MYLIVLIPNLCFLFYFVLLIEHNLHKDECTRKKNLITILCCIVYILIILTNVPAHGIFEYVAQRPPSNSDQAFI